MSRLETALDYFSVDAQLDKIMEYQWNYNSDSQYYDHYIEQINEMANAAADMSNELREIVRILGRELPWKEVKFYADDDTNNSDISWFNTALALIDDIDMVSLLANEDIWNDAVKEKDKRLKAMERLTKSQIRTLLGTTFNFVYHFMKLSTAFETIIAVIDELDYHQSAVKGRDESVMLHEAAWLA